MKLLGVLLIVATARAEAPLRLNQETVVARVLEVSNAVAGADFRVQAAARRVAAANAMLFPSISASASALYRSSVTPYSIPVPGMPVELNPDIRDVYTSGVRIDYFLFTGGAVSGARRAARQDLEASRHAMTQVREDLRFAAAAAYWDAVRATAGVAAAEAQDRRAGRMVRDTQALDDAGMATPADLAAARERAASAAVQLIRARAIEDNAEATLRSLMRLEGMDLQLADSLDSPLPPPPDSLEALQQQALKTRPEVGVATARQRSLMASSTAAGAGSWPDILAVAQWDYNRPNSRYFPTEDQWNDTWSVGVVGSWTLFDGGKARGEAGSFKAAARAAAQDAAELERAVLLEVETARNDLIGALAAVTAADAAREAAAERERQVRERHAAGVASVADLLDAEAQLSATERLAIETRSGAWIASARLDRAVGR